MNNETSVGIKFTTKVTEQKKLEKLAANLERIQNSTKNIDTKTLTELSKAAPTIKEIEKSSKATEKNLGSAFSVKTIARFSNALKSTVSMFRSLSRYTDKASAFLENRNLFQVAFNGNYESAQKFIDKMSEMYGLDESWLTRTVGTFKQLSNAMGLSVEQGEKLSELMAQMSLDVSSLFNVDMDRASSVLQSALAGQTKPIRGLTGGDITQATLQTTLDNLGIDRKIADLSYAEKRLIIIVSLTQQLNASIGDMGRTIEQPANQMRVLNSQWERLTRAVGNVFLPILAKVLPYLNAIFMVLVDIVEIFAKFVATLFGFDTSDFDVAAGVADSVLDLEDSIDGVGEGLDNAAASAKKLKQGLRGFDKLNNITTPTASTGTAGGAGGLGIDSDVMDAFNKAFANYNAKLKEIKMRATKIAEKLEDWLGITDGTYTNLKLIGAILSGLILTGITNIFKKFGLLPKDFSFAAMLGLDASTVAIIGTIAVAVGILALALYDLYKSNDDFKKKFDETWGSLGEKVSAFQKPLEDLYLKIFGFNSLLSVLKQAGNELWDIIQTIAETLSDILFPIVDEIILPVLERVIEVITDIIGIIIELWDVYGKPISEAIQEAIRGISDIFDEMWVQYIEPIVKQMMAIFDDLWSTTLKPLFKKIGEVVGELILLALTFWNNVLKPIIMWVIDFMAPKIETIAINVLNIFHWLVKSIGGIVNGLLDIFKGIIQFLTGAFAGNWEKALTGLVNIGKGIFNTFVSIVEGIINGIITGLNLAIKFVTNGIKSLINKIGGAIEGLAEIVGIDLNLTVKGSIPSIGLITIPRLQKGLNYVPSDFYPAFLDKGERVLTAQENRDYTANKYSMQDYKNNQPQTFNINVGSEKIATIVLKDLNKIAQRNGKAIEINA